MSGLQDNLHFSLRLGPIGLDDVCFSNNTQPLCYKEWLEYCSNLYVIEQVADIILPHYDGYTPENYWKSRIIRSYLKREAFIGVPRSQYESFAVDVDKGCFQSDGDAYHVRIITQINDPVRLCGLEYSIAEERVYLPHCKIESVETLEGNKERIRLINQQDTVQYEYCDADYPDHLIDD